MKQLKIKLSEHAAELNQFDGSIKEKLDRVKMLRWNFESKMRVIHYRKMQHVNSKNV